MYKEYLVGSKTADSFTNFQYGVTIPESHYLISYYVPNIFFGIKEIQEGP